MLTINNVGNGAGQIGISDSKVSYAGTVIGTFTGGSNGNNLVITFDADADATAVTALIEQITYENTDTDNPTVGNRTVRYILTDGDGATSENYDTTVAFTSVDDIPTIANLGGDTLNYSEGDGAAVIEQDANAAVSDVDSANFDTGTLTVSFAAGSDSAEDVLAINHVGNLAGQIGVSGSAVSYGGTQIGSFTGGSSGANLVITLDADATPTAVETLLEQITYENTDTDNPTTGNRTVRYVLTDGDGGTSANYDTTVAFTAINNALTITNLGGDTLNYSEGDGATVIEQGANAIVSDVDSANFDTGTLTVSFAAGSDSAEDVLAINHVGNGAGQIGISGSDVSYGGTQIGSFTGGSSGANLVITLDADATPTAVEALLEQITYENTDTDNLTTGNRTVRYVLTDGDGGTSANYDTTVTVAAVSDAPTINRIGGDTLNYSEGDVPTPIDRGTKPQVIDLDSSDFDTGTLTVSLVAGSDSAEDVLAIKNVGNAAGRIGISGSNVSYGGTEIGTFTGGSNGDDLVITLNANADAAAVSELLDKIMYENTDTDNPTTGDRTVRFVLTDGDGGTSANYDTTVAVTAVNDAATIANLGGDSLAYTEGDGVIVIEQGADVVVADVDSSNFDTGTLTVLFTSGDKDSEDVLAINNVGDGAGQIGLSGSAVSYGGTQIGTYTGGSDGNNLVITFNTDADATAVAALIEQITYENTNTDDPKTTNRNVRYKLTDGDGGTSANYNATIDFTAVNDAATISNLGGDTLDYTEGDGASVIGQGADAVVSDVDSSNFNNGTLTVSLIAGSDSTEDVLAINNVGNGAGQIGINGAQVSYAGTVIGTFTGGSNGNNLVITFDPDAKETEVTALIEQITYENTNTVNPTTNNRTVRYVLTDGDGGTSANYDTTVSVSGTADNLTLTSGTDTFVTGAEADTFTTSEANFAAADTLTGNSGTDTLTFNDAATITTAELANKTGIDIIQFDANSTAAISDAFVEASDNDLLELNNQAFTLSLDVSNVSAPETVEIGGTGQVTLSAGGVISSKDGINTNIAGSGSSDTFNSGTGADTYTGNAGADTFVWDDVNTSSGDDSARDVITDFSISEGDKLDISGMSSAFNARGMSSFAGETNQVIWSQSGDDTLIELDSDGDDAADWSLLLENFTATDLTYLEFDWGATSATTTTTGTGGQTVNGTDKIDFIYTGSGADTLNGGDNGDYLVGGLGKDTLHGGAGNDYLFAGNGDGTGGKNQTDNLYGDAGDDFLYVDAVDTGIDNLYGGAGNDIFFGAAGSVSSSQDRLYGEGNDDRFDFTYGEDVDLELWGGSSSAGSGNDHIRLNGAGAHGGNWTLTSGTDYTSSDQGNGITRYTFDTADADGSISMNDGSAITFNDIDYIEFD